MKQGRYNQKFPYGYSKAGSKQTERTGIVVFWVYELIYVDKGPKLVSSIQVLVVSFACTHSFSLLGQCLRFLYKNPKRRLALLQIESSAKIVCDVVILLGSCVAQ